jgi:hypothetical protein
MMMRGSACFVFGHRTSLYRSVVQIIVHREAMGFNQVERKKEDPAVSLIVPK